MDHDHLLEIAGERIELGQERDIDLPATQSYTGTEVMIPIRIWRASVPGPTVFVTGAVHGDELNGTGIVRKLILDRPFDLQAGSLILVPVVNVLGFERHSRYLPDRRDLNRSFPGSAEGSLASRYADAVFREIISRSDYGIDLHSAAVRRTNFPNVRGDLTRSEVARIARASGCEIVINGKGPQGSLRRVACEEANCAAILLEAGEVWKIEPGMVEVGVRMVRNVLIELGMINGKPSRPLYQSRIRRTMWVRAKTGGILQFHVQPGDVVEKAQALATNTNLLGHAHETITAPDAGIVFGITTLPMVAPGTPVCHLAMPSDGVEPIRKALSGTSSKSLHSRLIEDLATNLAVTDWTDENDHASPAQPLPNSTSIPVDPDSSQ
jgi:hypothetical protein